MSHTKLMETAQQGFDRFQSGLATGDWSGFLDIVTDDFTFWFPVGQFKGVNVGKDRAAEFFRYVSQVFNQGLTLTVQRITHNENTVIFEAQSTGTVMGKPYENQVAIAFDIRGDRICGYREYLGIFYQFGKS